MDETLAMIRKAGGEAMPYACDVSESQAIAALVAACRASYGGVDIFVNNVGGPIPGGPVNLSAWDSQLALNLTSVFLMCKHVVPLMEEKRAGPSSTSSPLPAFAGPVPPQWATRPQRPA